ncbi:MAG: DUF1616 domain-containing protein, partial [Euryarchaeota archaeon]|nr:DUF1616 domain-containing protein [Euryarchaeota archaeon]
SSVLPESYAAQAKGMLLLSLVLLACAWYRRSRAKHPWVPELSASTLTLLLLPLLLLGYATYTASQGEKSFTEFYVIDPPGKVIAGEPFPLCIGIVNHEGRSMRYTLRVAASGASEELELHRESISLPPMPVEKGTWKSQWEKNISISLPEGRWRITLTLTKPSGEELHLYINTEAT